MMYNPPHPGELIADIIDELGVSIRDFAQAMNIAPSTASRLINGEMNITSEIAIKLAVVLGSSEKFWLSLQNNFSLSVAQPKVDASTLTPLY